jgi:RimJ/RimL family protein N-acetyltransferase
MPGHEHEDFHRVRSPLQGRVTRLRAVEEADLPRVHELFSDPEVLRYLSVTWPQPLAGTRTWWEETRRDPDSVTLAIETLAGELVGVCALTGISPRSRSADLGIWVGRPYQGQGYGTDAVRTLCRFGFREMNLARIGLSVYDFNERARRAYEKVGFKEEGCLRRAHFAEGRPVDLILMGLLAEDLAEG